MGCAKPGAGAEAESDTKTGIMWKLGCWTAAVGLLLTLGSCFFFGAAAQKAMEERQVAEIRFPAGVSSDSRALRVNPQQQARVIVEAMVEIPAAVVQQSRAEEEVLRLSLPVNYEVTDREGETVHIEAGTAMCRATLPASGSPQLDAFDNVIRCPLRGKAFDPPVTEEVWIEALVPDWDDNGYPIQGARLRLYDQVDEAAGSWAAGGLVSLLVGPVIMGIGAVIFLIGAVIAAKRRAPTPPPPGPHPGPPPEPPPPSPPDPRPLV